MKQEAEALGMREKRLRETSSALDKEERATWRDGQKREVEIRMAALQAEEKKGADDVQMAKIEAAREQAKIKAEKELALEELELKAQQAQATISPDRESHGCLYQNVRYRRQ